MFGELHWRIENVRPYLEDRLKGKSKDYGFSSSCLQSQDPRATILQRAASSCFESLVTTNYYDIAVEMERVIELKSKKIYPNVDFYSEFSV